MNKTKKCNCVDIPDDTIHKIAAVLVQDKKTLVVKKKGLKEYISLGGKHEGDETDQECLEREAMEELGVHVSSPNLLGRYQDITVDTNAPITLDAYLVESLGDFNSQNEISDFIWIDRDYRAKNIKIASILEKYIVPELIKKGLM